MEDKIPDPNDGDKNETGELEQVHPYVGNRFFFSDEELENPADDRQDTGIATPYYEVACINRFAGCLFLFLTNVFFR